MDQLEKQIREKRAALDSVEEPEIEAIWQGVRQGVERRQSHLLRWRWISVAATLAILLGLNLFLLWDRAERDSTVITLSDLAPELAEQEKGFQTLIARKEAALGLDHLSREEFSALFRELDLLEEIHSESLQEIPFRGNNERLINTLIRYYELKILILEQLENEIHKKRYNESPGAEY